MIKTLSSYEVANELMQDKNANRTYEEAKALADFYEDYVESAGEEMELDIVAIRCEWSSYTIDELVKEFGYNVECEEGDDMEELVLEYIDNNTTVISCSNSILIMNF